jgi:hypothetical protein
VNDRYDVRAQMRQTDSADTGVFLPFLAVQVVWLAITVPLVTSFGITTTESLFVLAFVGWLSACVLFEPATSMPRWWRISVWVTRGGFVVLGYFVFLRAQGLGLV